MRILTTAILLSLCCGCYTVFHKTSYAVELSLEPGVKIKSFGIAYPGFKQKTNFFGLKANARYHSVSTPLPEKAHCSWIMRNGETKSVIVPVKSKLPSKFNSSKDALIFSVTREGKINFYVGLRRENYYEKKVLVGSFPKSTE